MPALVLIITATLAGLIGDHDASKGLTVAPVEVALGLLIVLLIRVPFVGVFIGNGEVTVRSWFPSDPQEVRLAREVNRIGGSPLPWWVRLT